MNGAHSGEDGLDSGGEIGSQHLQLGREQRGHLGRDVLEHAHGLIKRPVDQGSDLQRFIQGRR